MSDVDPAASFRAIARRHRRAFWLDGGGARDWSGGCSLMGWLEDDDVSLTYDAARRRVVRHVDGQDEVVGTDIFEVLEREIAESPEGSNWIGYFGYACRPDLAASHGAAVPDAVWMRARHLRSFSHPVRAVVPAGPRSRTCPPPSVDEAGYGDAFARVRESLLAGDSYEVNLTYRAEVESGVDPVTAYLGLRIANPAPYAGYLQHDVTGARAWLLSCSPERFATVSADRVLQARPIKGTTPRDPDPAEDERARRHLQSGAKFRAENLMIVDLLRHDLAQVCDVGTVTVPTLMTTESYAAVHQLVSTVEGRLRADVSTMEALRSIFPAGSMTGAPKRRTMEIIEAVEDSPRGAYAGAFGWIHPDGRADLGVVIRSLVTDGSGLWTVGTGGGITVDSVVGDELAETEWKAEALLHAVWLDR